MDLHVIRRYTDEDGRHWAEWSDGFVGRVYLMQADLDARFRQIRKAIGTATGHDFDIDDAIDEANRIVNGRG